MDIPKLIKELNEAQNIASNVDKFKEKVDDVYNALQDAITEVENIASLIKEIEKIRKK